MSPTGTPVCELSASAWLSPARALGITAPPNMSVPFLLRIPGFIVFYTKYIYIALAIQNNLKASRGVKAALFSKTMWKGPTGEYWWLVLQNEICNFLTQNLSYSFKGTRYRGSPGCGVALLPLSRGTVRFGAVSRYWCYTVGGSSHRAVGSSLRSQFAYFLTVAMCVTPITLKPRGVQLHTGLWEEFCLPGCEQMSLSPSLSRCVLPVVEPSPVAAPSPCQEEPWDVQWLPSSHRSHPLSLVNCCCMADSL